MRSSHAAERGRPARWPKTVAAALLFLALLVAGCSRERQVEAEGAAAQPAEVRVLQPETRSLELTIPVTGSLISTVQVDVKTQLAGTLLQSPPREGERVTKGQVIARQDEANYRLAVEQARAAVAVSQAGVARAKIAVHHADRELERARAVQQSGGITVKDFQSAEWAANDARAQLQLAEAQLRQARDTQATAEKKLRDCTIVSPITGAVQAHLQNEGAYLDVNVLIARLVDNSRLELEATVPSADLGRVRAGQPVRFTVDSFPGEKFPGRVVELSPALVEQSRSVKVRVQVPNPGDRLKAGMFAKGDIIVGDRTNALMLPVSVLIRSTADPRRATVMLAANGSVRRQQVELGAELEGHVEVRSGLQATDAVLAEPGMAPAEGQPVKVTLVKAAVTQ